MRLKNFGFDRGRIPGAASIFILVTFVLGVTFNTQVKAAPFSQFVAFGDSQVDSGWWRGALDNECGPVAPPCNTGNINKDGRIDTAISLFHGTGAPVGVGLNYAEVVAAYYGLTALPANQPGGTNYAISGAKSTTAGGIGNLNFNSVLPSTIEQIAIYLSQNGGTADPNALYMISSGGNDISYALDNPAFTTGAMRRAFLQGEADALAGEIKLLQVAGAQNIVVNGLQNSAVAGTLAEFFTDALWDALSGLGVDFIAADIGSLVADVKANPISYGFELGMELPGIHGPGTTSACVWTGPVLEGWGQWCGDTLIPSPIGDPPTQRYSWLRSDDAQEKSFYSDDSHFSNAGNRIVARYQIELIEAALTPTPVPAALPLFASGVGVIGALGWWRKRKMVKAVA